MGVSPEFTHSGASPVSLCNLCGILPRETGAQCKPCYRERKRNYYRDWSRQCKEYLGGKCADCELTLADGEYLFSFWSRPQLALPRRFASVTLSPETKTLLDQTTLVCANHWELRTHPSPPRRASAKTRMIELLGGACARCGLPWDPSLTTALFDIHHEDPQIKLFNPAAYGVSNEALLREVSHCTLLCKNCHRHEEMEQRQRNWAAEREALLRACAKNPIPI